MYLQENFMILFNDFSRKFRFWGLKLQERNRSIKYYEWYPYIPKNQTSRNDPLKRVNNSISPAITLWFFDPIDECNQGDRIVCQGTPDETKIEVPSFQVN